jgi:hypothetical protein
MAKATAKKTVSKDIKLKFTAMGQEASTKVVKKGFTMADAISKWNLQGLNVTVNGSKQSESYIFGASDSLVAVPQVKGGNA